MKKLGLILALTVTQGTVGSVAFAESTLLNTAYSLIKKTGFNPAAQLERLTGLKVKDCSFNGSKYQTSNAELGKCLLYFAVDYDQTQNESPIELNLIFTKTQKELSATLHWKPVSYRRDDKSWLDYIPTNYLITRIGEFRLLLKYYLLNDINIKFSEAVGVEDFVLPESQEKLRALSALRADEIILQTTPVADEMTLSGMLELRNQNAALLKLFFRSNWKAFSKAPFKADVHGRLIPVQNKNLGVQP